MADTAPTIIEDSTFSYTKLRNSTIRNCILRFVEVRSSTIQNSTLCDCKLFNCVVQKSTLTNTQLYETKIEKRCTIKGCTAAMSPLALRKLPPEVREIIFLYCVDFTDGKTPPLIVALRGDKKLYREAMRLFYKLNFFTLNKRTATLLSDMGATACRNIQKLKIEANVMRLGSYGNFDLPWTLQRDCHSIDTLHVCGNKNLLLKWTRESLRQLYLKKLSLYTGSASSESTSQNVPLLNKHLGLLGKLSVVSTTQGRGRETWFWVTENGKPLRWSNCGERGCSLE